MGPNFLALTLALIAAALCNAAATEPNKVGFSLELAPRNSNLTAMEMIRQASPLNRPYDLDIRPAVRHVYATYFVRVAIGSNPTRAFDLLFDTGSSFTWTQCAQCTECFKQTRPTYNPVHSITVQNLTYHSPYCMPPCVSGINGECLFNEIYGSNKYTKGYMVRERLVLSARTLNPPTTVLSDALLGCSLASSPKMFSSPDVDGILGMDRGSQSLMMQLFNQYHVSIFSHCLPELFLTDTYSFIRFGADVILPSRAKSMSMLQHRDLYYVPLVDVTVGDKRLHLPGGSFALRAKGTGGCLMDTGTTVSRFITPAYNAIKGAVVDYFSKFSLKQISGEAYAMDLCYEKPAYFNNFPTMDLHFAQADGDISMHFFPQPHLFIVEDNVFCLAILGHPDITIIGSMLMQHFLIVYDLPEEKIYFAPENCNGR